MSKPNLVAHELGEEVQQDIILVDDQNPRSVANLVPDKVREKILQVAQDYPQYFGPSETELRKLLEPDDNVCRLRISFWHEYHRAQEAGKLMQMVRVYGGITSHEAFYGLVLSKPQNVAWLLTPPVKIMMAMEEALNRGLKNLVKIMDADVTDKSGKIIPRNAGLFLKAFEMLNERVNGAVIQRIEQKNLNLSAKVEKPQDMNNLKEELEALRRGSKLIPEIEASVTTEVIEIEKESSGADQA